jgi:hypothetical protein
MSERKDERWLDDQLRRAVRGEMPRFDAPAWKRKHPEEYRTLVARSVGWGLPHQIGTRRWFRWGKPHPTTIIRLAVAAAIVIAIGLFALNRSAQESQKPFSPPEAATKSPAEIMTMGSLRLAYEQGGIEGLDRQLQNALDEFGPRSSSVSLQELF